jgi:DnaJ-class molecular chaperone
MKGQFAFQILGLESGSRNEAGASKSWKQLKVKLHPDQNPHPKAEEAFKSK